MSEHHGPGYYVKIYLVLLVLLVVSILGPELGVPILTLITAFGIALVKALMVAAYFMHLNIEKRYVHYMMYTMLLMVGLFFVATAADVLNMSGTNWINTSAEQHIKDSAMHAEAEH